MDDIIQYAQKVMKMAALRYEKLSSNYMVQTPEGPRNSGFDRDNTFDILEEVTDVQNILDIIVGRTAQDGNLSENELYAFQQISEGIASIISGCAIIDAIHPERRKENVERVVTRDEVGL